jgi:hypothetical protein
MKLQDYGNLIKGKTCKWCNTVLPHGCIEYYDHESGWVVEGFAKKQWLYVTCPKDGHQWSLEHLGIGRGIGR